MIVRAIDGCYLRHQFFFSIKEEWRKRTAMATAVASVHIHTMFMPRFRTGKPSLLGPGALCVGVAARRSLRTVAPLGARRSLCRAPAGTLCVGPRRCLCWARAQQRAPGPDTEIAGECWATQRTRAPTQRTAGERRAPTQRLPTPDTDPDNPALSGLRRSLFSEPSALCVGSRRSLCRASAARSLCRGPTLSMSGPGALCQACWGLCRGVGGLCVGPLSL